MNVVTIIGNLVGDVTLAEPEGAMQKLATFDLAVARPGEGEDLIPVRAWGSQAETCATYLSDGGRVALDGRLRSVDGDVVVVANRVQFLTSARVPS